MRFQWSSLFLLSAVIGIDQVFGAPCGRNGICSRDALSILLPESNAVDGRTLPPGKEEPSIPHNVLASKQAPSTPDAQTEELQQPPKKLLSVRQPLVFSTKPQVSGASVTYKPSLVHHLKSLARLNGLAQPHTVNYAKGRKITIVNPRKGTVEGSV